MSPRAQPTASLTDAERRASRNSRRKVVKYSPCKSRHACMSNSRLPMSVPYRSMKSRRIGALKPYWSA